MSKNALKKKQLYVLPILLDYISHSYFSEKCSFAKIFYITEACRESCIKAEIICKQCRELDG